MTNNQLIQDILHHRDTCSTIRVIGEDNPDKTSVRILFFKSKGYEEIVLQAEYIIMKSYYNQYLKQYFIKPMDSSVGQKGVQQCQTQQQ